MNFKELLVDIIASDQRIRDYEKRSAEHTRAENNIADKCIKAYKEAVIEFCKRYEEMNDGQ